MVLTTNALLGRDETGKLVPIEVEVPELGGSVFFTPILIGESKRIKAEYDSGKKDADEVDFGIMVEHIYEPKLTTEQLDDMPAKNLLALLNALKRVSGLGEDDSIPDAIKEAERALEKNSDRSIPTDENAA